jgi:prepilin-type N-terminal cleavage/methylation domain-containing protein/prepilin-type processing-associated H-X9-DG protein
MKISANARTRHGFDLVELLLVVAIVAVMAAILFPVFGQIRSRMLTSADGAQKIKRISIAVLQYVQDHDDKFPRSAYDCKSYATDPGYFAPGEQNQCGGDGWVDVTAPYLGPPNATTEAIFHDVNDNSAVGGGPWGGGTGYDFNPDDGGISFIINDMLDFHSPTKPSGYADITLSGMGVRTNPLKVTDVKTPSQCLLLAEAHGGWDKAGGSGAVSVQPDWTGNTDIHNKWHSEYGLSLDFTPELAPLAYGADLSGNAYVQYGMPLAGNIVFVDGHASVISYADSSGSPLLCHTLPWTKDIDPLQRHAERDSCNDTNNPVGASWTSSNWF